MLTTLFRFAPPPPEGEGYQPCPSENLDRALIQKAQAGTPVPHEKLLVAERLYGVELRSTAGGDGAEDDADQ